MCGITGIATDNLNTHADGLQRATDALKHRGPDDGAVELWPNHGVGFGHRRLTIIDLSPAGRNPMCNEDEQIWITFNGEIYNFGALRAELIDCGHTFRSRSDTEVILHAYEEWGDDHVCRLRGMFAYAIYDRRRTEKGNHFRLVLVRDHVGIKPLFYYWDNQDFIFASEIKGIREYGGIDLQVDRSGLYDYLTYGYIPAPKTAYTRIRKVEPGHLIVFENKQIHSRQYWDVSPVSSGSFTSAADTAARTRELIGDAVELSTVSDVPIGVLLSGGMDSSTIAAMMADRGTPPATFTIGFDIPEHSETQYARLAAEHCGGVHHERCVGVDSAKEMLPKVTWMYDEPYSDGSAVPTYRVSQLAREHVKVVLGGDGGDEVFAGYTWYNAWLRRLLLDSAPLGVRKFLFSGLAGVWPQRRKGWRLARDLVSSPIERYARLMEVFSPEEKRRILGSEWTNEFRGYDDHWFFRGFWRDDFDPLTRLQYLDLKTYLPNDILTKIDRASMAVSLEMRPPLLDPALIEYVFSIPARLRAPDQQAKHLMKAAVGDMLPPEVLARPKKGFSAPWSRWMHTEWDWASGKLRNGPLVENGMLVADTQSILKVCGEGLRLWAILVLGQWLCDQA